MGLVLPQPVILDFVDSHGSPSSLLMEEEWIGQGRWEVEQGRERLVCKINEKFS